MDTNVLESQDATLAEVLENGMDLNSVSLLPISSSPSPLPSPHTTLLDEQLQSVDTKPKVDPRFAPQHLQLPAPITPTSRSMTPGTSSAHTMAQGIKVKRDSLADFHEASKFESELVERESNQRHAEYMAHITTHRECEANKHEHRMPKLQIRQLELQQQQQLDVHQAQQQLELQEAQQNPFMPTGFPLTPPMLLATPQIDLGENLLGLDSAPNRF
ncbi:uncharacterized protein EI90DRAFT_3133252 [Cantharellus anzutake]|uniref:uncharacterized protein n=1 Tax=Cantharellus anzutake TaxID=1750568 RepID=UPI0019078F3F|nr:uncharacterized protein EI90DRAFT_3133252 [Cantharellus anzutake]KAF8318291.1 hypothetical protein EI90DRAFT_3133252 [Cantharellus anzutake]